VAQFGERRIDINRLDQRFGRLARRRHAGRPHDQRTPQRDFVQRVLSPDSVLAQVPAMVAPYDDDRVVAKAEPIQFVQHAADLRIDVTHARRVGVAEIACLLSGNNARLFQPRVPRRHLAALMQADRRVDILRG
jgi:hypothetical protein